MTSTSVPTKPYNDQKPGTSGLRKRVKVFQQENYVENFVQATFTAVGGVAGATLVVGGDGRYFSEEAIQKMIRISAGNKVTRLIIGHGGILSTPAVSNLVRIRRAAGALILTASHNPGGPDADFGLKYNVGNGGPASENVTSKIFDLSKSLTSYQSITTIPIIDLSKLGEITVDGGMKIEIIDSVEEYVAMMKRIFDFDAIRRFITAHPQFKLLFDGMHGVTGPYGRRIFVKELGLPPTSVMNDTPLPDFGGGHPDPNLTYAHELVERVQRGGIHFGAASDGDGDRNMIISNDAFVNPSDSVAVIAAYAHEAIPFFRSGGVKGLARSMPTSTALDKVAKAKGLSLYEVPTGWKFFGNLMDAGRLSICGEESFGTGSDHIREKDGLWAILAWLSILAHVNQKSSGAQFLGIKQILRKHFDQYGRNFFTRYDYEEVDSDAANRVIAGLNAQLGTLVGKEFGGLRITLADNFSYTDPIDKSVSSNQGLRVVFVDSSRIIFRLSGTGSQGATIRVYVEKYESNPVTYDRDPQEVLKPLVQAAMQMSNLKELTGREKPTVIT